MDKARLQEIAAASYRAMERSSIPPDGSPGVTAPRLSILLGEAHAMAALALEALEWRDKVGAVVRDLARQPTRALEVLAEHHAKVTGA